MATNNFKNKAARIDFSTVRAPLAHPNPASATEPLARPLTAPGAMLAKTNDMRSAMLRENEELRERVRLTDDLESKLITARNELQAWDGALPTRFLNPAEIRPSAFANRHESSFASTAFDRLRDEIRQAGGNVQPIKVRPVVPVVDGFSYEIVYGHRRHRACQELGIPVKAILENVDDLTLFGEMDRENRERADLSLWEQGVMYDKAMSLGLYPSQRSMATALGLDLSHLNRALTVGRLPAFIVGLFSNPTEISLRMAMKLNEALARDPDGVKKRSTLAEGRKDLRTGKRIVDFLIEAPKPQAPVNLNKGSQRCAQIRFDEAGRPSVTFDEPLNSTQLAELRTLLEQFIEKSS